MIPGVSTAKSIEELANGVDPITQEPASRLWAGIGLIPGGKIFKWVGKGFSWAGKGIVRLFRKGPPEPKTIVGNAIFAEGADLQKIIDDVPEAPKSPLALDAPPKPNTGKVKTDIELEYGLASLDSKGNLDLVFEVPKDMKGQGVGEKMFESAMKEFGEKNIKGINGTWIGTGDLKDNFDSFVKSLGSMSKEEAAFETFTGKMAKKHGYTNVEVNITLTAGTPTKVSAVFTKPEIKK